jgi:hypothetical protein
MVRDLFPKCEFVPPHVLAKFMLGSRDVVDCGLSRQGAGVPGFGALRNCGCMTASVGVPL